MATRGTISIENEDGSIETVYSHWDNYLSSNGNLLQKFYNDRESVKKLISGGGISSLGEYVSDTPQSFNRDSLSQHDYTVFYSYRGEPIGINRWSSFDDYERHQQMEEFNYIFTRDNVWSVYIEAKQEWFDLEYELQQQELI